MKKNCTKWHHIACSMDIILLKNPSLYTVLERSGFFREQLHGATLRSGYLASRYAVFEAEWLLWRAITIVRETSATSSQSLMIQTTECVYNREPERS